MTSQNGKNAMFPYLGKLVEIKDIGPEIKLFGIELLNGGGEAFTDSKPGQFAFVSAFGVGEAPFGIASTPQRSKKVVEFAVQRLGSVTNELHQLGKGDIVGLRGPLGNSFPMEEFKGKNLVVLGGGIGAAPLRPVLHTIFDNRKDYGHLTILMASRNPSLHVFQDEYDAWQKVDDTELHLIVDEADEKWEHQVGLSTDLLKQVNPKPANTIVITCGPPVMIYFVDKMLTQMGFAPEQRYVTLEARMHCGVGKCGRCNLGEKLVCVDGPVFSMEQAGAFLESYL
jgi:sulfhydrogenase subunit gamma (sulfur reductase)